MSTISGLEAKEAVNIFVSVDILGLLSAKYKGSTIEEEIKEHYINFAEDNPSLGINCPSQTTSLQEWVDSTNSFSFNAGWNAAISRATEKGCGPKRFDNKKEVKKLFEKYVRLIASYGDAVGWKLSPKPEDYEKYGDDEYLKAAYNLSVKAKPDQWIRWWGNSITPFSSIHCAVRKITNVNQSSSLSFLDHQQSSDVKYRFPELSVKEASKYEISSTRVYSTVGQLKCDDSEVKVIKYDLLFDMVDHEGDIIARLQADPEIRVVR